ncbi:MAG: Lrp/AsnC family transcriptional regulator [Xanthobacteraceae bacterium]|nr:MAG: Lrp/AsnC family transcriptional regulator [Xanthobacteraceae bacterium]
MLDAIDRRIINELQGGVPLSHAPYAECAARLGLSEDELLARLGALLKSGALTRFGPLFNVDRMGGRFCLCAMAVPEARWDEVVAAVNAFAEVAHNYRREHALNMWFVLAVETPHGIAAARAAIARATGLEVHLFPKLREFFIDFRVSA